MDIALKLKRVVATVAAGAIFASSAGIAIAQTFSDVPTTLWCYDYVEQLVDDGVIDVADEFRPSDPLNRAELVKMAMVAIDGLAGYEAPATPTFDDVPADAWFFDYVEAAVQLGVVSGEADAQGNLTGMFNPSGVVNRAAATKILVNAFSVPTDLEPGSIFPDVKLADWFYDYVVTAYNQSVVDGYQNGYFGPSDPVTRCQVAKLAVLAQDPQERMVDGEEETPGEETPGEEAPTTSEGDLEVSLNDNTPSSSTLPLGANGVALASFDFTADQDDVWVSNLVVTRGGVGQSDDWESLYLYDGVNRLTTGRTINNDTNTATFPLKLTVEAGTTVNITLVGDVQNPAGASNQHYFYVASAADVTSNAQSVSGDFPVAGNTFTMGGANTVVNSVTVEPGTAPSKVSIGEMDAEVASIKLTAGAQNDLALHQLALTNGGSLSSDRLINLRLLRGTDEVATAEAFVDDVVTFALDTPYVIDEGQSKTFYVHADVDGGRSTDNIILYLDENTDVVAVDQQYGYGASVTNEFTQNEANTVTLEGGDVTVVDNGPAAKQIAQNATNVELLNFSVTTDRDLTVRDTFIRLDIQDPTGTGPSLPATGSGVTVADTAGTANEDTSEFCMSDADGAELAVGDMIQVAAASGTVYAMVTGISAADAICMDGGETVITTSLAAGDTISTGATVTEVNPYDFLKNVKLVDLDSGNTLAGPMTDGNAGATIVAGPPTSYTKLHTEDYEFTGGDTRHLSIQADLDQNMASGYQVRAQVQYPENSIKDLAANEFVATTDIIGAGASALAGDYMLTAANNLAVSRASTPTSQDYVKGDDAVPALGVALTAGDAGDIVLKRLNVRVYADDTADAGFSATGFVAADTLVASVTLYDGNDVVSGPESISLVDTGAAGFVGDSGDYYRAQFDDLNMIVEAGTTKTLVAKLNLLNTATAVRYVAVDVLPSADIIAEDDDANTVVASGAQLNAASPHLTQLTILTSGDLTASSEGNPDADILVAGTDDQLVAKYRFHAQDEDFQVKKLSIVNDLAGNFGDADALTSAIENVTIKYTDVNGVQKTASSSLSGTGEAKFAGLDFYVPAGEDAYLEVYADVNTKAFVGQSISGKTFRLGLQNVGNSITTFEAIGQSSSTNLNFAGVDLATPTTKVTNSANINSFVVRTTVPTFANVSASTSLANGERTLQSFSVTADSAGSVAFGRLVFDVELSNAGGTTELEVGTFKFYRGSTLVTAANIYGATTGDLSGTSFAEADNQAVIVSFNQEESIAAGSTQVYSLKASVTGSETDDSIDTKLNIGDENTPVSGVLSTSVCGAGNDTLCSTGNGNTGRIYDTAANEALLWAGATEFSDTDTTARNILWSDKSADAHTYPTVAAGSVTAGTGSFDWTNGYLLDITNLSSHNLQKN